MHAAREKARSSTDGTVIPHPLARELAMFLAGGDENRLEIINRTTIIVTNHPRPVRKTR